MAVSMGILEQTERAIQTAEKVNKKLDCFVSICSEQAIEKAKKIKKSKKKGKLHSIAISVKDNICTKGIRTTAGSAILSNYIPPYNATVIEKIQQAEGIVIGKTAMDAFGFGTFSTNVGKELPIAKNPHDRHRSTGGSSGGAGAFTAAASVPHAALAVSTGGSITAPATFCGVVGFTPTYGKVSRYGLIDYANSLDKIGTMGKTVAEAEVLARIIFGKDEKDETSLLQQNKPAKPVKKVAVINEMNKNIDKNIRKNFEQALSQLKDKGISYEEVSFPWLDYSVASYYIIATAEASSNLARYCGMRYGAQEKISGSFNEHFAQIRSKYFSAEEKRRIILGTFVRTAGYKEKYYLKALKIREKIRQEFALLFKKYHALLSPAMPILPPKFDEIAKLKPIEIYALDRCTIPPNLTGLPHLSIPMGKVNSLPTGIQIVCNSWEEDTLFAFGKKVEAMLK